VQSLYHAKRQARKHGVLPPDRRRRDASPVLRGSQPPRFVEAIRRMDAREGNAAWRIRFPGGVVLESTVPLSLDETLRLIEKLEGRA